MSKYNFQPVSQMSKVILPATGSVSNVTETALPFGIYIDEDYWTPEQTASFKQGAVEEVAYVYQKLGGDVLDIELVENQVYTAYEEACLEYSYIVNLYQTKNSLSRMLGGTTGVFDSKGQISGSTSHAELAYPEFNLGYARRVAEAYSGLADLNGSDRVYSASIPVQEGIQDYDLQKIVKDLSETSGSIISGSFNNKKILIKRVYYKTLAASWNFYGYFGGLNVVGNLSTYGQYADDSTFEIIPVWQNKLQAMNYKDAIKTRLSDYSYQLKNNRLRLMPTPSASGPQRYWFEFVIPGDAWEEDTSYSNGVNGVNNLNTLPFQNIPYDMINSIGKQWIRRFALSLCKEMLGYIRSKFSTVPIPGDSVTLNGSSLISEAKQEQRDLKDELSKILEDTTYDKLAERDASIADNTQRVQTYIPNLIFTG
jgi:hypothetical protein